MSKLVTLENLKPGMKLAEPITNKFGQVLFETTTKLEEKHKQIFKTWGITKFYIFADKKESEQNDESVDEKKQKSEVKINWTPKNDYEKNLIEMVDLNCNEAIGDIED